MDKPCGRRSCQHPKADHNPALYADECRKCPCKHYLSADFMRSVAPLAGFAK